MFFFYFKRLDPPNFNFGSAPDSDDGAVRFYAVIVIIIIHTHIIPHPFSQGPALTSLYVPHLKLRIIEIKFVLVVPPYYSAGHNNVSIV